MFVPTQLVQPTVCGISLSGALAYLPEDVQTQPEHLMGLLVTSSLTLCHHLLWTGPGRFSGKGVVV